MSHGDDARIGLRGRQYVHAALIAAVLITSAFVVTADKSAARTTRDGQRASASSGQTIRTDLLPAAARTFRRPDTHWKPMSGGHVAWTPLGRHSRGALVVRARRNVPRAASPTFHVTALKRYSATAYLRSGGRVRQALALQFLNVRGQVIDTATEIGQHTTVGRRWTRLLPTVAFAPTGAVRGRIVLVGASHSKKVATTYVDDVVANQISGAAAPIKGPLRVHGRDIVDGRGHRVVLRGIQVLGMEHMNTPPVLSVVNDVNIAHMWGANMIRLSLNPDKLNVTSCAYDRDYLAKLDQVVKAITATDGMVAELNLQGFSLVPCGEPELVTMPDQRAVSFWQKIASRYQGNPRVVFDLFNEPHDVTSDVWLNGGTVEYKGISYVAVGMRKLYDTVRGTGAKNVVFVSGVSWSGRPSQLAPLQGVTNVVYAAHAYTCPTGLPQDGHACNGPKVPGGNLHPTQIIDRWAPLAAAHPVVFDEFGWPSATDGRYDTNTIAMIAHRHWSGWVAFTLNGSTSGLFNIVRNIGSVENPTIRGMAIMSGLFAN